MPTHAKPRHSLTARIPAKLTNALRAKSRRKLTALAAAAIVGPGLAIFIALPAQATIPPNANWVSSRPFGIWNTGKFDLYNNEWNTGVYGPQTIWGYSFKHWGVQSTQPDSTSVKVYPSVQENYKNTTLGSLHGLWSHFAESMPSASKFDAEAAYDLWLHNGSPTPIEFMMWVDNHGQRPSGQVIGHATIYGQTFSVWRGNSHMFSFALSGKQETKGTAHLLKALVWLEAHGYISSSDTLGQVNFGWEICSTDGKPMDFTVTNYNLTTKR